MSLKTPDLNKCAGVWEGLHGVVLVLLVVQEVGAGFSV